ncbi:TonB-dependent receptor [Erythrobacter sp. BLCC-B19]|uniref:TonB-dependent receptor n=1 Tax=Erythrobacter sp. BLCC-B19 TaxID=3025315 RepID=UPI002362367C|nr:TonB-dependent receptor [Erythrobacter sp. BLCC-B19]WDA41299.1 TonB-dependent receptor [Erythrobacter sp. BLCC-B19]
MKSALNVGLSAFALVVGLAAAPAAAQSQSTETDDAAAASDSGEIVVTALRRETTLQDAPISIAVVSSETIQQQAIDDFFDLALRVPNVAIFENNNLSGRTQVTIRGIPGRAGIFVDDVFVGDNSAINTLLVDVDRVEVLRGPQATLFGRNAISGAINTITRKPGNEFFAQGRARYGSYNETYLAGAVGAPIVEDLLAAKVSAAYRKNDGFDRERGGGRVNGDDGWAVQGQLRFTPSSNVDILISADYAKDSNQTGYSDAFADYSINGAPGQTFRIAERDGNAFDRIVPARSTPNDQDREIWGVSGTIDIDLGFADLKSITAHREVKFLFQRDGDGSEFDIIRGTQPVDYQQFSQEVRLVSKPSDSFDWLVGAYYFKDKRTSRDSNLLGSDWIIATVPPLAPLAPPLVPGGTPGVVTIGRLFASPTLQNIIGIRPPSNILGTQETFDQNEIESLAFFGSATWKISSQLELTGGLRYTRERVEGAYGRNVVGFLNAFVPPIARQELDSGWDGEWSPMANLVYQPSDDVTLYATYSTGFRSGGFNLAPAAVNPPADDAARRRFRPETVDNYEIGLKSTLLDGKLYANAAVFYMQYQDFQRSFFRIDPVVGGQTATFNAEASMRGFELEFTAIPADWLTITAGYGYQDSKYGDYPDAPVQSYLVPNPAGRLLTTDLSGDQLPFAPKHSLNLSAVTTIPLSDGLQITAGPDMQLRSSYPVSDGIDLIRVVDDTVILNGFISLGAPDGTWQLTGRVRNLTKEIYLTGLDYNNFTGTVNQGLSAPRTFAIEASFRF